MIHRKVVESDAFYDLSEAAQSLYAHLTINADDDGFCNGAKAIVSRIRGGKNALQMLVERRFLLQFGDIYVIKHWRIGNSMKNDRAKPPAYPGIAAALWVKGNRAYTDHPVDGCRTLLEIKTGVSPTVPDGAVPESAWNPSGIRSDSQRKGTEQKGTEQNRTEAPMAFGRLWDAYPEIRRGAKGAAAETFMTACQSEADQELAVRNLEAWKRSEQWAKDGGRYIPLLSNWLERGHWATAPDEGVAKDRALDDEELEAIRRLMAMEL
jgi:hypothetical protein